LYISKIHIYSKKVNTSNVIYWGYCKYFKEHVAKTFFKKSINENVKMFKKGPFVVEFFSSLGHLIIIAPTRFGFLFGLISLESILFFFSFGKGHFVIHLVNVHSS